jgi:hypothetical protein
MERVPSDFTPKTPYAFPYLLFSGNLIIIALYSCRRMQVMKFLIMHFFLQPPIMSFLLVLNIFLDKLF